MMGNRQVESSANIDEFISHLYRSAARIAPNQYRVWALEQLSQVIDFDAAFWGTGNQASIHFHYADHLGLDKHYAQRLTETIEINPIKERVINNLSKPIDMSDVISDEMFYQSSLYKRLFQPYGIERILATGHLDKNGLYSLLSLYRFDRKQVFTQAEQQLQQHLTFHLVSAASHAFFLHLHAGRDLPQSSSQQAASAICDRLGCFHEVQPRFVSLLNEYFPKRAATILPFDMPQLSPDSEPVTLEINKLAISVKPLGDLVVVNLRPLGPLDLLSNRELQIVEQICKGLSFKEVAKLLSLAPSTVSNHLYRVYDKLAITSRTELAQLVDNK